MSASKKVWETLFQTHLFAGDQAIIAKTYDVQRAYVLNIICQGRNFIIFASKTKGSEYMGSKIINDNRAVEQMEEIKYVGYVSYIINNTLCDRL